MFMPRPLDAPNPRLTVVADDRGFVLGFTERLNEETAPAAVLFLRMPTCFDPDNARLAEREVASPA
jgi:hypothetical protein